VVDLWQAIGESLIELLFELLVESVCLLVLHEVY
jgi:hypothetical protein